MMNDYKFINILIGDISTPKKTFLVNVVATRESVNSTLINQLINDTMHLMDIDKQNHILLIYDAASYITKSFKTLKILFPF